MWMNLEPVIQSEMGQKKKNKYPMLLHIYGIQKNGTDEPIGRARIEVWMQRRGLWTQQEREGEQIERVALTYICTITCKTGSAKLLYSTGRSA